MQQWQHAWISMDPNDREDLYKLEQMGNEGWEMVSVIAWSSNILMVFFKRHKPDEAVSAGQ